MRLDAIYTGNVASGQQVQQTIGKGHLNGLLIFTSVPFGNNHTVTIKRRSSSGPTYILASQVSFGEFSRIHDIERGSNLGTASAMSFVLDRIKNNESTATGTKALTSTDIEAFEIAFGELGYGCFYIDLGSIYSGPTSELDISINFGGAGASGHFRLYRVSLERRPDVMLQYDSSFDLESTHRSVDSIFLFNRQNRRIIDTHEDTNLLVNEENVSIQIEDGQEQVLADLIGCFLATQCFGQVEGIFDQNLVKLYSRPDALPREVFVKITGTSSDRYKLLVRKVVYDAAATSANTVTEAARLVQDLAALEKRDPATARALRHAGETVKASDLAVATQAAAQAA